MKFIGDIGNPSPKQKDFLQNGNARLNILDGAVRAGKTKITNLKFFFHILKHPFPYFLITGTTSNTIKRNVLYPFFDLIEPYCEYKYNGQELRLLNLKVEGIELNKVIYIIGTGKEDAVGKIKGMEVAGWYADEITETPQSVVEMCLSRCSQPNSKIYWTTNPGSPYHPIYTNYIQRAGAKRPDGTVRIKRWHFEIEDNTYLSKTVIDDLKHEYSYSSTAYKRYILGEWVNSEGLIYDSFNPSKHILPYTNELINNLDEINISCDYGSSSANVFGVIGVKKNHTDGNKYYLVDENYYDFAVTNKGLTDNERLNMVLEFQNKYKLGKRNILYLPHDAKSLKDLCIQNKDLIMKVKTYKPNTYEDITKIQNLFSEDRFYMTENCINSIKQAQLYSWDSKAQQRGEDKPLKKDDHCPDMWRAGLFGKRKAGHKLINVV